VISLAYSGVALLAYWGGHSWQKWLLALPFVAVLQNHLLLLHHDGAHGLLHPKRVWNDFLANIFCGFPFFELLGPYRRFHFAHHRFVADGDRDPEIPFYRQQGYDYRPLGFWRGLKLSFLDLCGYHWLQFFVAFTISLRGGGRLLSPRDREQLVVFLIGLALLLMFGLGQALLWYWLLPQMTLSFFLAKQRGYREHSARDGTMEGCTRNLEPGFLERVFLFPLNSHLHLAHHQNATLPWFELGRAQAAEESSPGAG
jgi:fatty acid desaturase